MKTAFVLLLLVAAQASAADLIRRAVGSTDGEKAEWVFHEAVELGGAEEIRTELRALMTRWPETAAAMDARRWLLEDAVVAGRWTQALSLFSGSRLPPDSTAGSQMLLQLATVMSGVAGPDSTAGEGREREAGSPWLAGLAEWLEARRALAGEGSDEPLRAYLALEGRAREDGWLGLWLAGFFAAPEGSPAREVFSDIWEREKDTTAGSAEGRWLEGAARRVEGPTVPSIEAPGETP